MSVTERSDIHPTDCDFPSFARRFVHQVLSDHELDGGAHTIDLLVSELVTYAIVGGEFDRAWMEVTVDHDVIRVAVSDPTSLLATVVADLPLSHRLRSGGIGLLLVDNAAQRWGIDPAGDGTVLWFELDRALLRRHRLAGQAV